MNRVGVICEFNPFHNGHKRLFDCIRAAGAKEIVCVMSDYFVQRCEPAIIPAVFRARAAAESGADAVFALPFPYSCASAEFFAMAGTDILYRLGCDTLAFGSESGDIEFLNVEALSEPAETAANQGSAERYKRLNPNDILAVEYLRAIRRQGLPLKAFAVKREGAEYKSESMSDIPSSTALRVAMRANTELKGLPESSLAETVKAEAAGYAPASYDGIGKAILAFWRTCDAEKLSVFAECGGGVSERLRECALKSVSFDEMMKMSATKRYTDARLRRAALFGMLSVTEADLKARAAYVRLIAANEKGGKMLKESKNALMIDVAVRVAGIPDTPDAMNQKKKELDAEALYTLSLPSAVPAGTLFRKSAAFI